MPVHQRGPPSPHAPEPSARVGPGTGTLPSVPGSRGEPGWCWAGAVPPTGVMGKPGRWDPTAAAGKGAQGARDTPCIQAVCCRVPAGHAGPPAARCCGASHGASCAAHGEALSSRLAWRPSSTDLLQPSRATPRHPPAPPGPPIPPKAPSHGQRPPPMRWPQSRLASHGRSQCRCRANRRHMAGLGISRARHRRCDGKRHRWDSGEQGTCPEAGRGSASRWSPKQSQPNHAAWHYRGLREEKCTV